ncbi:hypothetical protein [Actinoallomurus iriomotensis]|uniref:Uncharacterized protein n=1 Tax=Actinoallomurus iriomotensis TaxID=478107 RepID=A0A9W6S956_9ACTN|nr:hypothetical protein [Actinoallomurus iriomotensis]GLY88112.1 hypothetical protein Airi02_060410 [Actinoallomurus iriomotensis]
MVRFVQAVGWLGLLVFALPALGYLTVLLVARPRPPLTFAVFYVPFVVLWFLVALPIMALLWVLPPLPRAVVAAVVVYLVALVTPLAFGPARYPLYVIRCGRLPVVATTFAGANSYTPPSNSEYVVSPFEDHFFCSCAQAEAAGFDEFPIGRNRHCGDSTP